jgi:RNA polymerase sigma factor (TIGR02999 family)
MTARMRNGEPISALFGAAERGDPGAASALFDALYRELHRLARRELRGQGAAIGLGTTTLLHEAYLEMAQREPTFPDRARFMAYTSRVMRGLIIGRARQRRALKRGGQFEITSITSDGIDVVDHRPLVQVSDALDELSAIDPALTEIVDLKFFCGLSFAEIAALMKLSERTVQRHWEKARIYLYASIRGDLPL